jgi:hypothetical protein
VSVFSEPMRKKYLRREWLREWDSATLVYQHAEEIRWSEYENDEISDALRDRVHNWAELPGYPEAREAWGIPAPYKVRPSTGDHFFNEKTRKATLARGRR